jgi:transposase
LQKAKAVTKTRRRIRTAASAADKLDQQDPHIGRSVDLEEEEAKLSKVAKRIHQGYFPSSQAKTARAATIKEEPPPGDRRKGCKRGQLTLQEKFEIMHQVISEKELMKDVAKEYRTTVKTVSTLVAKGRRNPAVLTEMYQARDAKAARDQLIEEFISRLNEQDHFIDSVHSVAAGLLAELDLVVKEYDVRRIMRAMGMRYRKVVHVPLKANSELNLVLRQQWALLYLEVMQHAKVVLSIDETWVSALFGILNLNIFF